MWTKQVTEDANEADDSPRNSRYRRSGQGIEDIKADEAQILRKQKGAMAIVINILLKLLAFLPMI